MVIFEKQKVRTQVRQHSPRNILFSLNNALKDEFKNPRKARRTTCFKPYGLKDVKLKWRNFVDDDVDNSKEEKYVKRVVLEILKSKKASEFIDS